MSSENKIYEITQMMNDNHVIRGDVSQAAGMIKGMLSEKYIAPINRAIATENKRARKNPSREARLLEAMKPFMDKRNHRAVDKAIDALHMMETFKGLTKQMPKQHYAPRGQTRAAGIEDASTHQDGIYDVDERCANYKGQASLTPILLMMAMVAFGKSEE